MFCFQIRDHPSSSCMGGLTRMWGLGDPAVVGPQDALPHSPAVAQGLVSSALPSDCSTTRTPLLFHGKGSFPRKGHTQTFLLFSLWLFWCSKREATSASVRWPLDWYFSSGLLCWVPNCTNGPNEPNLLEEAENITVRGAFKIKSDQVLGNILPGAALPQSWCWFIGTTHPVPVLISKSSCICLGWQNQTHLTHDCGEQQEDSSAPPEPQPHSSAGQERFPALMASPSIMFCVDSLHWTPSHPPTRCW